MLHETFTSAASLIGRAPGSYPGLWGIMALAAHAIWGSRATGRRGGFKYRTVRVRIPPPLHGVADISVPIRSTGRTARSGRANRGSNPRWAAMPPRTAAAPLSYSGWPGSAPGGGSHVLVLQLGRGTGLRGRQLRVRIPPSTRCAGNSRWATGQPAARRALTSDGPCGGRGGQHPGRQLLMPAHACLVATVSTPPR